MNVNRLVSAWTKRSAFKVFQEWVTRHNSVTRQSSLMKKSDVFWSRLSIQKAWASWGIFVARANRRSGVRVTVQHIWHSAVLLACVRGWRLHVQTKHYDQQSFNHMKRFQWIKTAQFSLGHWNDTVSKNRHKTLEALHKWAHRSQHAAFSRWLDWHREEQIHQQLTGKVLRVWTHRSQHAAFSRWRDLFQDRQQCLNDMLKVCYSQMRHALTLLDLRGFAITLRFL